MSFEVRLAAEALADLEEILDWIEAHDSRERAAYVQDRILAVLSTLEKHPERGSYPDELVNLGVRAFRQVFFKPYRLIYGVEGKRVVVYVIADGRRDFQALLVRRLLAR